MRPLPRRLILSSLALLALLALAPDSGTAQVRRANSGKVEVITHAEILRANQSDVLAVIQTLKPQWLRKRGRSSINFENVASIRVYVDNFPLEGAESLRGMPPHDVVMIEFLDGQTATQRFGTNHLNGAILIRTGL